MDVEAEYWNNPEDIKIACYKWLPESQPKFILYLGQWHFCENSQIICLSNL